MFLIYMSTNTATGLSYIGSTSRSLEFRRKQHEQAAARGEKDAFRSALREFGSVRFVWRVLKFDILTKEEANKEEARLVSLFETFVDGYNMTPTGQVGASICTEDTRQKLSERAKARYAQNPMSSETKGRLSLSQKKRLAAAKQARIRAVQQGTQKNAN